MHYFMSFLVALLLLSSGCFLSIFENLVDHIILLNKVALYKINTLAIRWFKSYLNSRQQSIESEKELSNFITVLSGVHQAPD